MPDVTVADTIILAQQKLGDEAGELFTSAMLLPHLASAYRDLNRLLQGIEHPMARIVRCLQIPAFTSSCTFDYLVSANFYQAAVALDERQEDRSLTISTITGTGTDTVTITTSAPHLLAPGNIVALVQTGWRWLDGFVSVTTIPSSTQFTVRGTLAIGTITIGSVSIASNPFQPIKVVPYIQQWPSSPATRIEQVAFTENGITFWPCSTARQLRLVYESTAPEVTAGDLIGMDDAKDFLAIVAGAYAADAKGATTKYEKLSILAFGDGLNRSRPDGGVARALLQSAVRSMQQQQFARPRWRGQRIPINSLYPLV